MHNHNLGLITQKVAKNVPKMFFFALVAAILFFYTISREKDGKCFMVLVAPGFRPASCVTLFCGRKNIKKLVVNLFLNFNIKILARWVCASVFFKESTNFKMGVRGQLQNVSPLKFKMATKDQLNFWVGAKTKKNLLGNYTNFIITFPKS